MFYIEVYIGSVKGVYARHNPLIGKFDWCNRIVLAPVSGSRELRADGRVLFMSLEPLDFHWDLAGTEP